MLEKIGYLCLGLATLGWLSFFILGLTGFIPLGLMEFTGLFFVAGIIVLFFKVLRERLANREDDYYDRTVDQ